MEERISERDESGIISYGVDETS